MANENVFWSGKVSWVNTRSPDKFGRYGCCFYPNQDAYNEIMVLKQQGLQNMVKQDKVDGSYFINVSRPTQIVTRVGKIIALAPVEILGEDGKTPYHGEVGNGTDATIKVEIRKYKKPAGGDGVAIRLVSIRLDHLIPVTSDDFPPARKKSVEGLATAPRNIDPWDD